MDRELGNLDYYRIVIKFIALICIFGFYACSTDGSSEVAVITQPVAIRSIKHEVKLVPSLWSRPLLIRQITDGERKVVLSGSTFATATPPTDGDLYTAG
jgi:hypothetical protein